MIRKASLSDCNFSWLCDGRAGGRLARVSAAQIYVLSEAQERCDNGAKRTIARELVATVRADVTQAEVLSEWWTQE